MHINTIIARLEAMAPDMATAADRAVIEEAAEALYQAQNVARPLGRVLANILDVALPYLDRQAKEEKLWEQGKVMRQITCQSRAEAAKKALVKAESVFGFEP